MNTLQAIILAIVEGFTEFLPISSTGHLIIANAILGIDPANKFSKLYIVNIQFGAILSVLFLYWRRFLQSVNFYYKLFIAFLPAAVFGFLLNDFIDKLLESVTTVAISMITGGIVLVWVDKFFKKNILDSLRDKDYEEVTEINELGIEVKTKRLKKFPITYRQAFIIGMYQVISMIPGVSRAAITTLGGLIEGLNMKRAAEFSFFLAVPTIAAAAGFKLYKSFQSIRGSDMDLLIMGNIIAFVVAIIAIRFFIGIISRYGLKIFGWYRIVVGTAILLMLLSGKSLHVV
ncbi:MAG: undecaprenyl-diphosphate phosphatase [Chitinophagales bacterium]|nr:undecaprenyl-diphosphate phosphatase [Chitinophagales bacterium]